ncbi:MAG: hypothetical protein LBI14_06670 [Treponema sp.]|jgi:PHD/YefM family antitoxin component YafN of YafNO toxin-antitoxin module|nr:hypothetical protein [Treponema sp.]
MLKKCFYSKRSLFISSYGKAVYMTNVHANGQPVYITDVQANGQPVYVTNVEANGQPVYITDVQANGQPVYMSGCFPASELVNIRPDEYVPIGSLKTGDKIGSWDLERKKMQYTSVTGIHKYIVNDIICFNNAMRVSASHPLMVVEQAENGIFMPIWKVAFDVNVGDCMVGVDGKLIAVKIKGKHWYNSGVEVLNLSTDCGAPFLVGNCVVRAENAQDSIEWANTPVTQKLLAA